MIDVLSYLLCVLNNGGFFARAFKENYVVFLIFAPRHEAFRVVVMQKGVCLIVETDLVSPILVLFTLVTLLTLPPPAPSHPSPARPLQKKRGGERIYDALSLHFNYRRQMID